MNGSLDVTGDWEGIFNYPRHLPPTGFRCTLRQNGAMIVGETREPQEGGPDLIALIEGECNGGAIRFVKRYDSPDRQNYAIEYYGTLSPAGDEITGRWAIPGQWSGTFIMIRQSAAPVEEARQVSETVD